MRHSVSFFLNVIIDNDAQHNILLFVSTNKKHTTCCNGIITAITVSELSAIFLCTTIVPSVLTQSYPLQVSHTWPAHLYILPILTFSIIYNIPKFLELEVTITRDATNVTDDIHVDDQDFTKQSDLVSPSE